MSFPEKLHLGLTPPLLSPEAEQCVRLQRGGPHYSPSILCSYSTRTPSVGSSDDLSEGTPSFAAIACRTELLSDMRLVFEKAALR